MDSCPHHELGLLPSSPPFCLAVLSVEGSAQLQPRTSHCWGSDSSELSGRWDEMTAPSFTPTGRPVGTVSLKLPHWNCSTEIVHLGLRAKVEILRLCARTEHHFCSPQRRPAKLVCHTHTHIQGALKIKLLIIGFQTAPTLSLLWSPWEPAPIGG